MTVTATVDLRASHGPVRDQGERPTCMAFALSDLNGQRNRQPASLSPEHLYREAAIKMPNWRPGDGLAVSAALAAVAAPGQPPETMMPYQALEPGHPLTPNAACAPLFRRQFTPQSSVMAEIVKALEAFRSIGLVIRLTPAFHYATAIEPVVQFSPDVLPGAHAVLAVGLGGDASTSERHVLIRNSWGAAWGDGGHAWLPEQYLVTYAVCAFGD